MLSAGLPNISGTLPNVGLGIGGNNHNGSGAFSYTHTAFSRDLGEGYSYGTVGFDASRSSAIYGATNTVQPPALSLIPQIRF